MTEGFGCSSAAPPPQGFGDRMQMLGVTGLRNHEGFPGPTSTDAGGSSHGSFVNLKMTAEKLVREQTSVNTDLEIAHTKLRRATEQINLLQTKFRQAINENVELKVKQTEDSKLCQRLDSKISTTKTLCDQLTETLQQLSSQTEIGEEDKKFFQSVRKGNSKDLDEFISLLHDSSTKLERAEKIISGNQEMLRINQEKEHLDRSCKEHLYAIDTSIKEKDLTSENNSLKVEIGELKSRITELQKTQDIAEDKIRILESEAEVSASNIDHLEKLASGLLPVFLKGCHRFELGTEGAQARVQKLLEDSSRAKINKEELMQKTLNVESENRKLTGGLQSVLDEKSNDTESLQGEIAKRDQQAEKLIREMENKCTENISENNEDSERHLLHLKEEYGETEELMQKTLNVESQNRKLFGGLQSVLDEKSNDTESRQGEIAKRDQQAEKLIREMENKCTENISENNEDSERHLLHLKEEYGEMEIKTRKSLHYTAANRDVVKARYFYGYSDEDEWVDNHMLLKIWKYRSWVSARKDEGG